MIHELINRFKEQRVVVTPPSDNIWESGRILKAIRDLNEAGRNNIEVPSPNNLRTLRQNNPLQAKNDEAHRKFVHKAILRNVKTDKLPEEVGRQRIVLWDLLNGFGSE